eukprot:7354392-Ditylum_brightwellii.AAC.1
MGCTSSQPPSWRQRRGTTASLRSRTTPSWDIPRQRSNLTRRGSIPSPCQAAPSSSSPSSLASPPPCPLSSEWNGQRSRRCQSSASFPTHCQRPS